MHFIWKQANTVWEDPHRNCSSRWLTNTNKGRFLLTAPGWGTPKHRVSQKIFTRLAVGTTSHVLLFMLLAPHRWGEGWSYSREMWLFALFVRAGKVLDCGRIAAVQMRCSWVAVRKLAMASESTTKDFHLNVKGVGVLQECYGTFESLPQ